MYFTSGFAVWLRVGGDRFLIEENTGKVLGFRPGDFDVHLDVTNATPRLHFTQKNVAVGTTLPGIERECLLVDVDFTVEVPGDKAVEILTPSGDVFCIVAFEIGPGKVVKAVPKLMNAPSVKHQVQALGGNVKDLQGDGPIPANLVVNPAHLFPRAKGSSATSPEPLSTPTRSPESFQLDAPEVKEKEVKKNKRKSSLTALDAPEVKKKAVKRCNKRTQKVNKREGPETRASKRLKQR